MLRPAYNYSNELKKLFAESITGHKFKYYQLTNYAVFELKIENDEWSRIQKVSICDGEILGFLEASIDREVFGVSSLSAINFHNQNYIFSRDLYDFIIEMFDLYRFRSVRWTAITMNPAVEMYDRIVKNLGGRVVGIEHKAAMLRDGNLYDLKLYEILQEDYYDDGELIFTANKNVGARFQIV